MPSSRLTVDDAAVALPDPTSLPPAALLDALSSIDPATAQAIVDTANSVMVTRLRAWALGRGSIREVDRSVQRALDLIFSPAPE